MSFSVAVLPHLNIQMRKLQPQSFVKSNNAALLLTMFLFCNSCNPPETRDLSCPHLWPPSHHDKSSEYNCHVTVPHVPAPMVPIVTAAWRHVPTWWQWWQCSRWHDDILTHGHMARIEASHRTQEHWNPAMFMFVLKSHILFCFLPNWNKMKTKTQQNKISCHS